MQLNFSDIKYEIEVIDLKFHNVEFHSGLNKQCVLCEFDKILYSIQFPVFLKKGKKYFLIARHWVYAFFVNNAIYSFPAFVFKDESLLNRVFEIDRIEFNLVFNRAEAKVENREVNNSYQSRKTKTKYKAISTGRICPFCGGVLRGPRTKIQIKKGKNKITCENKSNRNINEGKGCDFYAILTDEEFQLFKKYELPTSKWFKKLDDKKCPKCNSEVFLRAKKDPATDNVLYFIRCRNYKNSTVKSCTYNQKYRGKIELIEG